MGIKKYFHLFLIAIALSSCTQLKQAFINYQIKDAKVENTKTIKHFLEKNKFNLNNQYIIKADTNTAYNALFKSLGGEFKIFDKNGNSLCYNGISGCSGVQFRQLMENKIDSFKLCTMGTFTLQNVLNETYDLNDKPFNTQKLAKADYYIIVNWAKFVGAKKGYNDNIVWMEKLINKRDTSALKINFIKINTDLQENWGLQKGKKVKIKLRFNKKGVQTNLPKLPIAK